MYALFVACLVIFLVGMRLRWKALGDGPWPASAGKRGGRARRFVEHVILQRRIAGRADSRWVHLPIFWGVVVLLLGSLVILLDSYLLQPLGYGLPRARGYRLFQGGLDLFGLIFLLGVGLALRRRLWTRPEHTPASRPMLVFLWLLLGVAASGFVLEGLRLRIEGEAEPWAFAGTGVAAVLGHLPWSDESWMTAYRLLWWGHVVGVFGLIAAVPFSRLRHIVAAPLQTLVAPEPPSGGMTTPFRLNELMESGGFDFKPGVDSREDLSRGERLGLSACSDFGGCLDVCPARAAGTELSPMRMMAGLREVAESGRGEPRDRVSEQAIWSCTMCGACARACPVQVDPMHYIVQLRRGLVAANRLGPERTATLTNLSYARNPYGGKAATREGLAGELGLPVLREPGDADLLYWIGCAATFDSRAREVAASTVRILERAGIRCGILGPGEICCGDPARRIGEEGLFQDLALKNIESIERLGVDRILTHCAHCYNSLRNEYAELGAGFEVVHHAELIRDLIDSGAIRPERNGTATTTFHDACYVARFNGGSEPPREVLRSIPGSRLAEMSRSRERTFCCGGGGANYWYDVPRREKPAAIRLREAQATGSSLLVTECPFCLKMFEDAAAPANDGSIPVRDIAEVVLESLAPVRAR